MYEAKAVSVSGHSPKADKNREVKSVSIERAENGYLLSEYLTPLKTKKGEYPPFEEPRKRVFTSETDMAEHIKGCLSEKKG